MKNIMICFVLLFAISSLIALPQVPSVTASQRTDASKKVDIYYNLSHNMPVTISLQASNDNGATWNLPCTLVTGDKGANISPGNGKHIVWDVLAEHPDVIYENVRFKVIADDGQSPPPPANFVFVQGGTFNNGTSNVTVSSFYMDKYELTQAGYQAVMGSNPASGYGVGSNYPVYYVSWFKAIEYCNLRSISEGLTPCYSYSSYGTNPANWPAGWNTSDANHTNVACNWTANGYRLPTEMEWQYAARGGNQSNNYTYSGSNTIGNVAWYSGNNSPYGSKPVGTKTANELGLFDMSGNVWEWNWDIYGSYPSGSQTNPTGAVSGSYRVLRGGCWVYNADFCPVSYRYFDDATFSYGGIGFRICRVSP